MLAGPVHTLLPGPSSSSSMPDEGSSASSQLLGWALSSAGHASAVGDRHARNSESNERELCSILRMEVRKMSATPGAVLDDGRL